MNAGTRFLRPLLLALLASLAASAAEMPDPRAVAERVAAVNRAEGLDAAMEALNREHAAWLAADAEFYPFYAALWNEAQLRTGRDDPGFFAAVFDWLQKESVAGAPASLQWDQAAQEGGILLGAGNKQNPRRTLKLAPGTMAVFALQAPADADAGEGLTVSWTTEGKEPQTSEWTLEPAEEGVPSAVIGAGLYRNNPFYSVPIFHHYQDAGKREGRAAIRVSATSRARIEIHDSADRPVAVDADGDGSLSGKGDSIFQDEDFDGAADLPLTAGEAMFRLQVYPHDPLPEEGIGIVIEVRNGGAWVVTSRNRIVP